MVVIVKNVSYIYRPWKCEKAAVYELLKLIFIFPPHDSPSKTMKNVFDFI